MDRIMAMSEAALLKEYDETMEVDTAAATNQPGSTDMSDDGATSIAAVENPQVFVVPAPEVPLTSNENSTAPAVVSAQEVPLTSPEQQSALMAIPAPEAATTQNPDPVSGATGSNPVANSVSDRLSGCRKFQNMSLERRIRMVLLHHCCSRCLSAEHISRDCTSEGHCGQCKRKHHSMLHSKTHVAAKSKKRARNEVNRPDAPVNSSPLPLLHVVTFSVGADKIYRVNICSQYDSTQNITFTVKVKKMIGIQTPLQSVSDSVKIHFPGLQLADPSFNVSGKVALVIGPEIAPQVLKGKIYSNPDFQWLNTPFLVGSFLAKPLFEWPSSWSDLKPFSHLLVL
ncbi:uncharacterized protein LOC124420984 [Lucilia cuprina]|uniref:uncharacterized protein LOC124420984 n=1 Tax=Lucilia cuprina TaxID=7375 RepID=UPI001F06F8BD|nr:uncharacterized protein LOC124420984 [Lucilia cuprina]